MEPFCSGMFKERMSPGRLPGQVDVSPRKPWVTMLIWPSCRVPVKEALTVLTSSPVPPGFGVVLYSDPARLPLPSSVHEMVIASDWS
jgi:hypothetical protein